MSDDQIKQLFSRIHALVPTLDGWCSPERACEYAALIVGLRMDLTVCLGVWGGRDVIPMALAHQAIGRGRVIAIDAWQAAASVEGQSGDNEAFWSSQPMHDLVYGRFLQTLRDHELGGYVEIHRERSSNVAPPAEPIDLLIVDGNHGPEAFADICRWAPHVRPGGIIFCDDVEWDGGAVRQGMAWLEEPEQSFRRLYPRDSGIFMQRTGGQS